MAQILVGSDRAVLFPKTVCDADGKPLETDSARLLQSVIMGKYLTHGFDTPSISVEAVTHSDHVAPQVARTSAMRSVSPNPISPDHLEVIAEEVVTLPSSDKECDESDIVETVQVHIEDPGPICNASVQFNRL